MGTSQPTGTALLRAAVAALGDAPPDDEDLHVRGSTGLVSPLPVGELAVGAVAAQLRAARLLGGGPVRVELDARHVGFAFRSERFARQGGRPVSGGWAPLSRFWRTADGWVRLHGSYPQHAAAALRALGLPATGDPDAAQVAAAAARWEAAELEEAVVAGGGAGAAVRSTAEWAAHPQGAAVAGLPLLRLDRAGDAPPRAPHPGGPRVLDLTRVIAGPVAGRTLASHGAQVLRLDSPRLPEDPGGLLETGPGKRHAVLDLASRSGRAAVEELLAGADAVVQGYRPGALDAFGLDPTSLAERHPHLVVVRLRAWGGGGPWAARRGFDSLVQAACGIADLLRDGDGAPGALPAQALDHATGHLAAAAALRGLARRRAEGGTWVAELSLAQTARWLTTAAPPSEVERAPDDGGDVGPYLVELPSPGGPVTLVAPPGSPVWRTGPVPAGHDAPVWLS